MRKFLSSLLIPLSLLMSTPVFSQEIDKETTIQQNIEAIKRFKQPEEFYRLSEEEYLKRFEITKKKMSIYHNSTMTIEDRFKLKWHWNGLDIYDKEIPMYFPFVSWGGVDSKGRKTEDFIGKDFYYRDKPVLKPLQNLFNDYDKWEQHVGINGTPILTPTDILTSGAGLNDLTWDGWYLDDFQNLAVDLWRIMDKRITKKEIIAKKTLNAELEFNENIYTLSEFNYFAPFAPPRKVWIEQAYFAEANFETSAWAKIVLREKEGQTLGNISGFLDRWVFNPFDIYDPKVLDGTANADLGYKFDGEWSIGSENVYSWEVNETQKNGIDIDSEHFEDLHEDFRLVINADSDTKKESLAGKYVFKQTKNNRKGMRNTYTFFTV